jgi:hypothetical protein
MLGRHVLPDALRTSADLGSSVHSFGCDPQAPEWREWTQLVGQVYGEARAWLVRLQATATEPEVIRPPQPTSDYCLLPPDRVRWHGEAPLRRQLWLLLEYLLSRDDYPFTVEALEESIWRSENVTRKTVCNTLSKLNAALEPVRFPWTWHVRTGHVFRDG